MSQKSRFAYAVMFMGVIASSVSAAEVDFRGGICITSAAAACSTGSWKVGDCLDMRYRPPGLLGNGPATRLSFFTNDFAENYTLPTGTLIGTTYKTVNGTAIEEVARTFTAQMRITAQSPATLTATSNFVSSTGNIQDFDAVTGCTVGFRASGTRRP